MAGSTEDRLRTEAVFKGGLGLRIQVRKGGGGKDVLCIGWHAKDGGRGRRRGRGGGIFSVEGGQDLEFYSSFCLKICMIFSGDES